MMIYGYYDTGESLCSRYHNKLDRQNAVSAALSIKFANQLRGKSLLHISIFTQTRLPNTIFQRLLCIIFVCQSNLSSLSV